MRIELCAGGIGGIAVSDFQADMRVLLSEKESVIASFKAVSNNTGDLSGGVGSLQGAMEDIQARIIQEETALENARNIQTSMNDFLSLAQRVDAQVASDVNQNKADFYGKYPELRSTSSDEEKAWYEKAWEALCGVGEAIKESVEDGLEFIADTLKNAWDGLVDFYNEHKKIIDTVLLIVGAIGAIAAVIATGGLALAPLLGALGLSATVAAAVSTAVAVVAVVSTVAATGLNVADVWLEVDNPIFNAIQTGLNITSTVTNLAYSIGSIYNSFKGYKQLNKIDWDGYPDGAPRPKGYYRILDGDEYDAARKLANSVNNKLHRIFPEFGDFEFHEILPVKFGGSPSDIVNKIPLSPETHRQFTVFWNRILKGLK